MTIPAGWYPDPTTPGAQRFWDGQAWTPHVSTPPSARALRAPEGTEVYTPWIWLVVLLPLLPLVILAAFPGAVIGFDPSTFSSYDPNNPDAFSYSTTDAYRSPLYWLSTGLGWAIYGACVLFAFFDHRALVARGVPQPFHWAWAFLNPVYPIGRSVVVKRRTGRGIAPMWVAIGGIVASFIVAIILFVWVFSTVMGGIMNTPGLLQS